MKNVQSVIHCLQKNAVIHFYLAGKSLKFLIRREPHTAGSGPTELGPILDRFSRAFGKNGKNAKNAIL